VRGDADWPQFGYSADGLWATTARVAEEPQLKWERDVEGRITGGVPVVGEGKLFYRLYTGGMVALDAGRARSSGATRATSGMG
jgi:outer membrane protein assembly factor BamB